MTGPCRASLVGPFAALLLASAAYAEDTSFRSHLGVDAAERLLASPLPSERRRGLERLGDSGTPRAITRLERALEPGGSAATPEERLVAVRALANLSDDQNARRVLVRVLGGHATPAVLVEPNAVDVLAERTAALALADRGTSDAVAALGKALTVPGRAAEAARAALVAHPPKDLALLLKSATLATLPLAETLSDLGDPRAANRLRELVVTGSEAVRAVALVALSRLGDSEAPTLAKRWTTDPSSALRIAGARILVERRDAGATKAVLALLGSPETVAAGVELAEALAEPALLPALEKRARDALGDERAAAFRAIGAAGGSTAAAALARVLPEGERAVSAADALARMKDDRATDALEAALRNPATRRIALRAAAIRRGVLGKEVPGATDAAALLERSKDVSDRAAAWVLRAAEDPSLVAASKPPPDDLLFAVSPESFLEDGAGAPALVARLAGQKDDDVRTALAFALAVRDARASAPTRELVALVDSRSLAAPVAAWALAARDEERSRSAVIALLRSPSPLVRAHAALGLGHSDKPDAAGLLDSAYRFETEEEVREAIVRALVRRGRREDRTLALASRLDPSPRVRLLAEGKEPDARSGGSVSLWLVTRPSTGTTSRGSTVVVTPEGLALPVVCAPDGEAVVLGLPEGAHTLRVAPEKERDNDVSRGDRGGEESSGSEGRSEP